LDTKGAIYDREQIFESQVPHHPGGLSHHAHARERGIVLPVELYPRWGYTPDGRGSAAADHHLGGETPDLSVEILRLDLDHFRLRPDFPESTRYGLSIIGKLVGDYDSWAIHERELYLCSAGYA
jgi:hypothetical protein